MLTIHWKKYNITIKKIKLISLLCCLAPHRIPRLYTLNWLRLRELRISTDVIGNSIENNKSHIQFKVHSNVIFPPLSTLLCRRKHLSYFYKRIPVKRVIRLTTFNLHRNQQDLGLRFHHISLKLFFFSLSNKDFICNLTAAVKLNTSNLICFSIHNIITSKKVFNISFSKN